ncbi:MAG: HNH endonuclease family protein, partial [Planctomycetota bacterium]
MQQAQQRRNCSNCYFSRPIAGRLHCAIGPPAVQRETGEARWPAVKDDDTCGQFRCADDNPVEKDHWPKNALPIYRDRFGDYCKIPLTQGKFAKVDPEDYIWLSQFRWHCKTNPNATYAVRTITHLGRQKRIYMHRLIANTPPNLLCDHINHNALDNRKANLRNCTVNQNNANSR